MQKLTEKRAIQVADNFIASQTLPPGLTLKYQSIREYEGEFQVKYEKVFAEPTKESPPYLLVIVTRVWQARWGNP
jgi:hypothetical protein